MDGGRTSLTIWIVLVFSFFFSSDASIVLRPRNKGLLLCSSNEFRCLNNLKCIKKIWLCDGETDCADESDEAYCSSDDECPDSHSFYRCKQRCIPKSWRCDGFVDCPDDKDEQHCIQNITGEMFTKFISKCLPDQFQCLDNDCIRRDLFCNGVTDCKDGSDEKHCGALICPYQISKAWYRCSNKGCIPKNFWCDGVSQCEDGSDEKLCPNDIEKIAGALSARHNLSSWFLRRKKNGTTSNKWGYELHRTATALYLSDPAFFMPGNITGREMAYELTIQLLSKFSLNTTLSSQELALYINALVVACMDPKDFYGRDILSDLRKRVEEKQYTNPFEIIALCNAGDSMTNKDVERISKAYDSQHRPFWTDIQALAVMAMACLSRFPSVNVDQRTLRDMTSELKKRQHLNGTVENLKTTGLVLQALLAANSLRPDFDLEGAVKTLVEQQNSDGSYSTFLDAYYALPALSYRSLISINTSHCQKTANTNQEAMKNLQSQSVKRIQVQYSVFIGQNVDLARSWKLKVPAGSTLYTVMETIQELDPRFKVEYNVFNGKPYPCAMFNVEDDPESELYWFVYKRVPGSKTPQLLEASPVDMNIQENEELILWYKYGNWNDHKTTPKPSNELSFDTTASL